MRPLWFDEVFTATLSALPSLDATFLALADAADTPAPGYYVLQRLAALVVTDVHLALRLASVVSVPVTCLFCYIFVRREVGATAGVIAAVAPLLGTLYHDYSVEARPYAVTVALAAVSAAAWQRADSRVWGAVLVATRGVSTAVNYYAVFSLAPIALAEAVRWRRGGGFRPAVPLALAAGVVPLLWWWANLWAVREYYATNYWSLPSLAKAIGTYDYVVSTGVPGTGFGVLAAVSAGLVLGLQRAWRSPHLPGRPQPASLVLVLGFLAQPLLAVAVSAVMNGGYTYRYALSTIVGVSLGLAFAAVVAGRHAVRAGAFCLVAAFAAHDTLFWVSGGRVGGLNRTSVREHQRLLSQAPADLPVAVFGGLDFAPLAHYASPADRTRLVGLVDPEASTKTTGSDSVDLDLLKLRKYAPFRVEDFETFIDRTPVFVALVTPAAGDWWHASLRSHGFAAELIGRRGPALLLRVQR